MKRIFIIGIILFTALIGIDCLRSLGSQRILVEDVKLKENEYYKKYYNLNVYTTKNDYGDTILIMDNEMNWIDSVSYSLLASLLAVAFGYAFSKDKKMPNKIH